MCLTRDNISFLFKFMLYINELLIGMQFKALNRIDFIIIGLLPAAW